MVRIAMRRLLAMTLICLFLGCSSGDTRPRAVPASGTVKYKKTEIPVGALVVLHPKDPAFEKQIGGKPYGKVTEDGTFQLTTYEENDGAPPGEYGVTVEWRPKKEAKLSLSSEGGPVAPNKLNLKYGNPSQPFKQVTIGTGENKIELEVD